MKYEITVTADRRKLNAYKRFFEGHNIPVESRPHAIAEWGMGLYTDAAHIDQAALLWETHGPKINVLTGEIIGRAVTKPGGS